MQDNEGKFLSFGTHSYTDYHHEMGDPRGFIEYPLTRPHPRYVRNRISQLERGIDPKNQWISFCKPHCEEQKGKLSRCEEALKSTPGLDDNTCLYRYRNWFECMENCVQPKIFYHLRGASRRGHVDWFKPHARSGLH